MKIPGGHIRKQIYAALFDNIHYPGPADVVPVYENEGVEGVPYQIIIADYSDTDASNKHQYIGRARQVIEIVKEGNDATRKGLDDIGTQVALHIQPSMVNNNLSDTDFQVMVDGRPDVSYLTEDSGSGTKIVRLIMSYNLLVLQKTY